MIKTSSAKAKGRNLQQWTRDILLAIFPWLQPDDVRSTSMGASGEDIQFSPKAREEIKLSIECKARNSIAVYTWYEQAKKNCPKGSEPVLVIKQDRSKPLVVIDAEYFFKRNNYNV